MAFTTPAKRSASEESSFASKRAKIEKQGGSAASATDDKKKKCIICGGTDTTFPMVSLDCKGSHANDVCKLCWTKYINVKLFASPDGGTKCVQCPAQVPYAYIRKITGDKNYKHYDYLVRRARAEKEGHRECVGDFVDSAGNMVSCHSFHYHREETDGRVFDCKKCSNQECVRCGVREHQGETCEAFQARLKVTHGADEALTAAAFEDGYVGKETVGKGGTNEKDKLKLPKPCPACGILIERQDKCKHMTCERCGNQFCYYCSAPYFGKNSVPQLGNKAHQPDCTYYKREQEDRRFERAAKKAENSEGDTESPKKGRKQKSKKQAAETASVPVKVEHGSAKKAGA
ncbi:hypothetical protein LTR85_008171 [Meristemomyces frigidus]|nr:hypothetical protein LTR85_008171 [Meristemomyces frigidus]